MKFISRILIILALFVGVGFLFSGMYDKGGNIAQANFLENLWNKIFPSEEGGPLPAPQPSLKNPVPPPAVVYKPALDYEQAVIAAIEKAAPAVISIIVTKDLPIIENCRVDPFGDLPEEFKDFFGPFEFNQPCEKGTRKQEVGGGSGFIVSSDGMILTNKHVVSDTKADYTVLTNDGKKYPARVLARDPVQDLAVVKIDSTDGPLPVLKLGDSDSIKLGQSAIAIGNALGEFRNTVSVGIVSGLARAINAEGGGTVERLEGLIQTDAAINPGNSGGPLLNLKGEVIGINTAVARGAENIGFAIVINKAKRDIESVKKSGKISIPFLGVRYIAVNSEIAKRDKLPVETGAVVRGNADGPGVMPNSPAAKAGIQSEDIILELNGEKITPEKSLASLIQKYNVGDTVRLKILRAGKESVLNVTLAEREF